MPDDPILDAPTGDEDKPTTTDSPTVASQMDLDALKEQVSGTARAVETLTQTLQAALQAPAPEPAPDPTPEPDVDDTLRDLTTDPQALIERITKEQIDKARVEQFEPPMQALIDSQHRQIMAGQKAAVDAKYGGGVWEEKFLPALNHTFAQVRAIAPAKLAEENYIKANVGVIGYDQIDSLTEARASNTKKQEEALVAERAAIVNSLPAGTIRRTPTTGDELDDDGKAFLARIADNGGGQTDPKEFARLHGTDNDLESYLKVTGQSDKLEEIFGG